MTTKSSKKDNLILKRLEHEEKLATAALDGDEADFRELQSEWQEKDSASENNIRTVEWEQYASLQDALSEIEDARQRLETGSYGLCETCDEPIPEKRLAALPTARNCVPCQEKREAELGQHAPHSL